MSNISSTVASEPSKLTDSDLEEFDRLLRKDMLKGLTLFPEIQERFRPRLVEGYSNFDSFEIDMAEAAQYFREMSEQIATWNRIIEEQARRFLEQEERERRLSSS